MPGEGPRPPTRSAGVHSRCFKFGQETRRQRSEGLQNVSNLENTAVGNGQVRREEETAIECC